MKLGKFYISGLLMRNPHYVDDLKPVMEGVIVYDIRHNLFEDQATYIAHHDSFEDIHIGDEIPFYQCIIENGVAVWSKMENEDII